MTSFHFLPSPRATPAAALALLSLVPLAGCGGSPADNEPGGLSTTPTLACEAALEDGAPFAMPGYCSTLANRSTFEAPSAPHVKWSSPAGAVDYNAAMAIDAMGRAYIVSGDLGASSNTVQRVDPPGTVAWTTTIDAAFTGSPVLGADGNLRFVSGAPGAPWRIVVLDPDGGTLPTISLPRGPSLGEGLSNALNPVVGTDGSLYLITLGNLHVRGQLVKLAAGGTLAWSVPQPPGSPVAIALEPTDDVIELFDPKISPDHAVVMAFDPMTGARDWEQSLPGTPIAGPAIRPDRGIVVVTQSPEGTGVVWLLSPSDGTTVWSSDTGAHSSLGSTWVAVDEDGWVAFVSNPNQVVYQGVVAALDPVGLVRWQHGLLQATVTSPTIDASGRLLITGTKHVAIDLKTGATRWRLGSPGECPVSLAVSAGRAVYGLSCDGRIYAASD